MVVALAVVGAFGMGAASADQANGVYNVAVTGTRIYDGKPVVEQGKHGSTLSFEYNSNSAGKTVTFALPTDGGASYSFDGVTSADCEADDVPSGNEAIECIGFDNGTLTVTFRDPAPSSGGQFSIDFDVDNVTGNHAGQVDWQVADDSGTPVDIIVAQDSSTFAPTNPSYGKAVSPKALDLDDYITVSNGTVTVNPSVEDLTYTYAVTTTATEAGDIAIDDTLAPGLVFDSVDSPGTIVTWDDDGLNRQPASDLDVSDLTIDTTDSHHLSGTVVAPGPSIVTITYTAHPDAAELQTIAQDFYDDHQGIAPDTLSKDLANDVTFNEGNEQTADVTATWHKAGVKLPVNAKGAQPSLLNDPSYVTVAADGTVTVNDDIKNATITYSVTYSSDAAIAGGIDVEDKLPAGMVYDNVTDGKLSVTATQDTWAAAYPHDQTGNDATVSFNADVSGAATDGQAFTGHVAVDGPMSITITYTAHVEDLTALQNALQTQSDSLGDGSGTIVASLTNEASFDGAGVGPVDATVRVQAQKSAGIDPGNAFGKTAGWINKIVTGDDDGNLTDPVDVIYTLTADLTGIDGGSAKNVIIADTLPDGIAWFGAISLDTGASTGSLTLTESTTCSASDVPSFQETTPGTYCIDGQTLLVNVGNDSATKAVVNAPARIADVSGLTGTGVGNPAYPDGTTQYTFQNTAKFYFGATGPQQKSTTSNLYVRPQPGDQDGYDVPDVFNKTTDSPGELHVDAGNSANIRYTFTVGAGKGIDATNSIITDYIDTSVFDLGADLSNVQVAGSYAGQSLNAGDFDVTQDPDGNLVISLTEDGKTVVTDQGIDKKWIVTITLTTIVFEQHQTETIYNRAVLTGGTDQSTYHSDVTSEATSYGNEYEVRKLLYNTHASQGQPPWGGQVSSLVDRDGNYIDNPFVYQINFIAHGNYNNAHPTAQVDELPDGVEFLGFIDPSVIGTPDFDDAVAAHDTSIQILGANLEASYDANAGDNGTVTVQLNGDSFVRQGDTRSYPVYFAVNITNIDDQPIQNKLSSGGTATVNPVSASVTWQKIDDRTQQPIGGSQWTIVGPDGDDSTTIDVTDDGTNDDNDTAGTLAVGHLVPGDYTLTETAAPAGYLNGASQTTFTVADDGTIKQGDEVVDGGDLGVIANTEKTYAVGDYTWIDTNRDGVQDDDEPVLPGVTVTLLDSDGNPVNDVDGNPVAPTQTDEHGRYLFDNLPAGDYQVQFTLTDEQQAKYLFTDQDSGSDDAADSDADTATGRTAVFTLDDSNTALSTDYADQDFTASQGVDPTWDAGVVERSYAVGDYTWIDSNRDGVQDAGEPVLPGVTVTLTDADGNPVKDVYGDPVAPTQTDEHGRYLFDNLPAGDYKVRFTLTDEQAAKYQFTAVDSGSDDAADSDATPTGDNAAVGLTKAFTLDGANAALTTGYTDQVFQATEGIDPTWDAGVNLKSVSVGDYVWIDSNRDGIQDEGEPGIEGVTLHLVGPDGKPVTDVYGKPVEPTVTDKDGHYSFDDLPALSDGQTYTVLIDREKSAEALKPYVPTRENGGNDRATDSSTWTATTQPGDLHEDGMRDPTLDFGFVTKSYAVGDYVWIDVNKDGVQGADEPVLAGVTVELLDGDGNVVDTTTTDSDGRYLFDDLPAGTYQVRFTLTKEQSAKYRFTTSTAGDDAAADSNADVVTGLTAMFTLDDGNAALTLDYDRTVTATQGVDPTWDAGVVERDAPTETVDPSGESDEPTPTEAVDPSGESDDPTPTDSPAPSSPIAYTGVNAWGMGGLALLLLGAGALLITVGSLRRGRLGKH